AAAGAADGAVPRRAVAGADVEQVELRVVGHGVPHRAAAAQRPPLAVPGFRRHGHHLVLEAELGIAGHGEEAPGEFAGFGVVGGDVAAHAVFGAAVADDDLALHHARRAGDGVADVATDQRVGFPHALAAGGVHRHQAA